MLLAFSVVSHIRPFFLCLFLKVVYSYLLQLISATIESFSKSQDFNVVAALEPVTILGYLY